MDLNKELKQLLDLNKQATSKKSTSLDIKRLNYYILQLFNNGVEYSDLVKEILNKKLISKETRTELICRITEQKICPTLEYNSEIGFDANVSQFKTINNVAQSTIGVFNSKWSDNIKKYNSKVNTMRDSNINALTKTFMLLEQVGIEQNVIKLSEVQVGKLDSKSFNKTCFSKLKGFHNKTYEIEGKLHAAEVSLFGGQQKYNEICKILSGELAFDDYAKSVINEAINSYKSYLEVLNYFNGFVNTQIVGDGGKYNFKVLDKGEYVYQHKPSNSYNMGSLVKEFNEQLEEGVVKSLFKIQAENHFVFEEEETTAPIEEAQTSTENIFEDEVVESPFESSEDASEM